MPTYEYEHLDDACALGRVLEHRQPMADAPLTRCPACDRPVEKVISRININTTFRRDFARSGHRTGLVKLGR